MHGVLANDGVDTFCPILVFHRTVIAKECVAVNETYHTISMASHIFSLGRDDNNFSLEKISKFSNQRLFVPIWIFRKYTIRNDGTVAAEKDVATIKVNIREWIGLNSINITNLSRIGMGSFPFRFAV